MLPPVGFRVWGFEVNSHHKRELRRNHCGRAYSLSSSLLANTLQAIWHNVVMLLSPSPRAQHPHPCPPAHALHTLHTWLSTDTFSIQGSPGSVESVGGIATSTSWQWLKLGDGPSNL